MDLSKFHEEQAAHLMLVLLFTFARTETPVAKAYSGKGIFDPNKQLMVEDVRVVPGALHVRLKGIKQDPRMQRPEAAGNNAMGSYWRCAGLHLFYFVVDWSPLCSSRGAKGRQKRILPRQV